MDRLTSRTMLVALLVAGALLVALFAYRTRERGDARVAASHGRSPVRVAYLYNYMPADHLDSLATARFDRALVRWITDSLDAPRAFELRRWMARGADTGVEVTPTWSLQAPARLAVLPTSRRYLPRPAAIEEAVGCPLDSLFWQSVLFDRIDETLAIAPGVRRLAVDLEIYTSSWLHHYDAGPCQCPGCLAEFGILPRTPRVPPPPRLEAAEERRLAERLGAMFTVVATRYPGIEIGIFDLDLDSFVHRAVARALAVAGVPSADYCEKSYSVGAAALPGVRARLAALGHARTPLIGGLWLKRFPPDALTRAAFEVMARADGYFVFTTYSLWMEPERLAGPYTLPGVPSDYWRVLAAVNGSL